MTEPEATPAGPLAGFGPATRAWFGSVFEAPTRAQAAAWAAIGSGAHALVIAPTGSGKTLAAFLHSLDRLSREASARQRIAAPVDEAGARPGGLDDAPAAGRGVRVLYVSPLKALAVDVERNLAAPLRGIATTAERLGLPAPEVSVAVRSGDTPAKDRRGLIAHPPQILITTPESLFLMLSGKAAGTLRGLDTVIVDEIHSLAGTKRGAHLALSLERLSAMQRNGDFQRIGLSATVRPPERVAQFLGGDHPVQIIDPPAAKARELRIEVPVEDMTQLRVEKPAGDQGAGTVRQSMWPPIERRILDLVHAHRSTICFVNSRQSAERLTAHLNELHAADLGVPDEDVEPPAQLMIASAVSKGMDDTRVPVIACAHHGSISKTRRAQIEDDLKAGRLACVVATSSLELGIDMGAVDLVIQVQAPPSVSSGLQRIGRAGHRVGAVSQGMMFPTSRGDVLQCTVVAERMDAGLIEQTPALRNPLDVLAQQIVSACLAGPVTADELYALVRRARPYTALPRSAFDSVLDMLAGQYPSEDFAELRPRVHWDRLSGSVEALPGVKRLVTTSGGTIPDRGLYGVFLMGTENASGRHVPGRRVGELDEEMVFESRVGDVFTLGTSSWRIEEITPSQVIVTPAPGRPGRLPFWHGDSLSRSAELGRAIGARIRELGSAERAAALARLGAGGLDPNASSNLMTYLDEQREATGVLPDDRTIVVERFRDEIGDWRLCVHSALGMSVLAPWALAIRAGLADRYGVETHVNATNDGIIIQLPDVDSAPPDSSLLVIGAGDVESVVTEQVFGSALFAARFRECAARALLLPRRSPGRRSPLWQQRHKAAQLLAVAAGYREFPIVVEAMRECLQDAFDLPALVQLMDAVAARRVRLVDVETAQASPFARHMLFGYVGEFVYDSDQPLAERRLAALSLDTGMLAELLGREGVAELIDEDVAAAYEAQLQYLAAERRASDAEQLWEQIRTAGPFTLAECAARSLTDPEPWIDELVGAHRLALVRIDGTPMYCVDTDAGLLRDALGVPVPAGIGAGEVREGPQALADLAVRWARRHAAVTAASFARRYGLSEATAARVMTRLSDDGTLVAGTVLEPGDGGLGALTGEGPQYVHHNVLTVLKRRTLAGLRAQVEPVEQRQFARFLDSWQQLPGPGEAPGGDAESVQLLLTAVDALAGYRIPASMLETVVLPARVPGYRPALLDQLLGSGQVTWSGAGAIGTNDGWVCLWPADLSPTEQDGRAGLSALAGRVLSRLDAGGAWRSADFTDADTSLAAVQDALWELVWAGLATSDGFGPLRELSTRGTVRRPRPAAPRRRLMRPRPARATAPVPGARWSRVATTGRTPQALLEHIDTELARYGVLTRGSALTEPATSTFSQVYRVLSTLEESGAVRRGYFVEGLGGAQFAVPGAVDELRRAPTAPMRLLAACDPANPYGAGLEWPGTNAHRPSRKAGALVVLDDGAPVVYLERGVHTLVTFDGTGPEAIGRALSLVGELVDAGRLAQVTIDRIDGRGALEAGELRGALESAGFVMTPRGYRRRRSAPG
ncbi:DEAD/DEAH box helicase [Propionibacterium australiense]|uniref:DEAD/DEAH box helicase n=1 Tax=Propionibacterium australiense TaxID=119981 RepID=A0A8B3FPG3_9ACTN|nr:DEAD/DEAH box helicase [Propionibacterium australiense]RLP12923.1 DEAD/DEAH box helicase [Propionibacterium australiense]